MALAIYHITVRAADNKNIAKALQKAMDLAVDWYKYHENCYLVYTSSDEDKWFNRLKPIIGEGGLLFICKIEPEATQGWLPEDFWKWIRGHTKPKAGGPK